MKRTAPPLFAAVLAVSLSACAVYTIGPPPGPVPPPPPAVVFDEPEYLYLVPEWGIYFVPGISVDILFYEGLWYYDVRGAWYWSRHFLGPWIFLDADRVPRALRKLPPDFRRRYGQDHYRVPYGHWKKRWTDTPPQTSLSPPPYLYKGPRSGLYAYPGLSAEIYLFSDRWYTRFNGFWYWSWSFNGPWAYLEPDRTPDRLRDLPYYRYDRDDGRHEKVPWGKKRDR